MVGVSRLGKDGVAGRGNCLKYVKRGETKSLKWGQAESRGGCLKKEGGPLANYV